jgi:signal transduction histidine kinase
MVISDEGGIVKFLENKDLRGKFIAITLIISLTGLAITWVAMVGYEFASYRHSTKEKLGILSRIIGDNVTAAILFNDPGSAGETLSALRAEPSVLMAKVIISEGEVFASFYSSDDNAGRWATVGDKRLDDLLAGSSSPTDQKWLLGGGYSSVLQPINMGEERVGYVYVMADNSELVTRLKWFMAMMAVVFLIVLIPIYFLSNSLRHIFTGPIRRLAWAMDHVSTEKDFSLQVTKETRDELGDLVDGFNTMLLEIRSRDDELGKHRLELEDKVKIRTSELESSKTALEMTVQELIRAKETAEAANVAKSNFLASMSHELRTPLNAVIGFSEVLIDGHYGPVNEQQTEYLGDILASGQHLLALITDILDIAKIETGRQELEPGTVNVSDLIEQSLVMIREKAHKHGITLDFKAQPDVEDLEINADLRKLKQVMFNLLSNAAKFTPEGGTIEVCVHKSDGEILISVADTGSGIEEDELEKIFEEFYQTEGGLTNKTPGTGLGLSLARKFVELHGGRIWAESQGDGTGSRFIFSVRIDSADKGEQGLSQ